MKSWRLGHVDRPSVNCLGPAITLRLRGWTNIRIVPQLIVRSFRCFFYTRLDEMLVMCTVWLSFPSLSYDQFSQRRRTRLARTAIVAGLLAGLAMGASTVWAQEIREARTTPQSFSASDSPVAVTITPRGSIDTSGGSDTSPALAITGAGQPVVLTLDGNVSGKTSAVQISASLKTVSVSGQGTITASNGTAIEVKGVSDFATLSSLVNGTQYSFLHVSLRLRPR